MEFRVRQHLWLLELNQNPSIIFMGYCCFRMLKKLDIHIASAVIKIAVVGQFAFFCLFIFIDLLDKFVKLHPPEGMSRLQFFAQYYLNQCPSMFQTTIPFIFVLCCLIALARFQHNSQIVAINAAGISTYRVLENLMILSLGVGVFMVFSQEFLTPRLTQMSIELQKSEFAHLMEKHLNFRDHCYVKSENAPLVLAFSQKTAVIDIDEIHLEERHGMGLHVTFMDDNDIPRAKLYSKQFKWDSEQVIELISADLIQYSEKIESTNLRLKNASCQLTIPLEKVVLASVDWKTLNFNDLSYFQANSEASTERLFRCITPFFPFLMLLVSSVLALPLIFKKPVYAYFAGLGCCFGVFLSASYLRSQIEIEELQPQWAIPTFVGICVGLYLLRRNRIPT
jgi:lipopolysaccharide export LptBFGC system permease protein LptF